MSECETAGGGCCPDFQDTCTAKNVEEVEATTVAEVATVEETTDEATTVAEVTTVEETTDEATTVAEVATVEETTDEATTVAEVPNNEEEVDCVENPLTCVIIRSEDMSKQECEAWVRSTTAQERSDALLQGLVDAHNAACVDVLRRDGCADCASF